MSKTWHTKTQMILHTYYVMCVSSVLRVELGAMSDYVHKNSFVRR